VTTCTKPLRDAGHALRVTGASDPEVGASILRAMGHGLSEVQVDAIYRAGVIAEKHSEALKRLMQDGVELPAELAEAARGSAESAGRFYEVAEKWKRSVEADPERE
jgi:hypothetical protein